MRFGVFGTRRHGMLIGVCGFGSTGSSCVSDYLKEFKENCVLDHLEFSLAYAPDGLADLEYHLMHPHTRVLDSIYAMERFRAKMCGNRYLAQKTGMSMKQLLRMTDAFLDSITQVSWLGYQNATGGFWKHQVGGRVLYYKLRPFLERRLHIPYTAWPLSMLRLAAHPGNFAAEARKFMHALLSGMGADFSRNVVLDQPFDGNNPMACFPFFEDPVAIVVDRDPRDNYVFAKTKLREMPNNRFMPTDSVHDFVKYYRILRDNQPYRQPHERVLRLQFEEMVYDYDSATRKIREFLHLPGNPAPKSIFDPSLSVANTQVFKRFPQFASDVAVIERELPEFLFDFSRFPEPDLSGEMFFGKSPKNR